MPRHVTVALSAFAMIAGGLLAVGAVSSATTSAADAADVEAAVADAAAASIPVRTQAITASTSADFAVDAASVRVSPAPQPTATSARSAAGTSAAMAPQASAKAGAGDGYSFAVNQAGHQAALDRCSGWVWEDFGGYGRVVSAHNHCGGAVVLGMNVGDTVTLSGYGKGAYQVTQIKRVPKGAPATVLEGRLWMQTCFYDNTTMRLVGLSKIS